MNDEEYELLQRKVIRTKKDLRRWESVFAEKHDRPPTIKDISDRPNIEKFYKKYNQLKKELKRASDARALEKHIGSPHRQQESIEFVRSPHRSSPTQRVTTSTTATTNLAEDEAFWLGVSNSSSPPSSIASTNTNSQPRLILGGSQKKKKKSLLKEQELLGRHTFHRRHLHHFQQKEEEQNQPLPVKQTTNSDHDDDDDDDMEGIEIVNHVVDPFRHYDPSVFHWEDPSFTIGPGFFGAATKVTMMLNDPMRRDRVLRKLEKGTLGEVSEENQAMEDELEEEIRQFIAQHHIIDHTIPPETTQTEKAFVYKKKPLQKRQTRLYKLKFVETR
ncbi:hypothetical protein EDC96DRAFT_41717 [Choanephora cucurbitarum]|nr:hypothetical protein EDC96DRAFT_41717 [Choanephora cucurbitarum]